VHRVRERLVEEEPPGELLRLRGTGEQAPPLDVDEASRWFAESLHLYEPNDDVFTEEDRINSVVRSEARQPASTRTGVCMRGDRAPRRLAIMG
jgi:hypothetical protein